MEGGCEAAAVEGVQGGTEGGAGEEEVGVGGPEYRGVCEACCSCVFFFISLLPPHSD